MNELRGGVLDGEVSQSPSGRRLWSLECQGRRNLPLMRLTPPSRTLSYTLPPRPLSSCHGVTFTCYHLFCQPRGYYFLEVVDPSSRRDPITPLLKLEFLCGPKHLPPQTPWAFNALKSVGLASAYLAHRPATVDHDHLLKLSLCKCQQC